MGLAASIAPHSSIEAEQARVGWPGFVRKIIQRHKLSRYGRQAFEVQDYDRSQPDVTTKRHLVEEVGDDGIRRVVHDTFEAFPAKRRPTGAS